MIETELNIQVYIEILLWILQPKNYLTKTEKDLMVNIRKFYQIYQKIKKFLIKTEKKLMNLIKKSSRIYPVLMLMIKTRKN